MKMFLIGMLIGMLVGAVAIMVVACCINSGDISEQEYIAELKEKKWKLR
jgi:gas vesicle protein